MLPLRLDCKRDCGGCQGTFLELKGRTDGAVMDSHMMFGDRVADVCCSWFPKMVKLTLHCTAS